MPAMMMSTSPAYQAYVGARGWEHAQWAGIFYPEDLPPEWHLTFYNNLFNCAYLSYSEWGQRDLAQLRQWVEDTHPGFRFVLQANPAGETAQDRERLKALEPRLGLVVADVETARGALCWVGANPDLKVLAARVQGLVRLHPPVYLISREPDLATLDQLKNLLEVMGV